MRASTKGISAVRFAVGHALLLGVGATVVTIGPTLVLLIALVFGLFGGHEEAIAEALPAAQERSARAEAEFPVEDAVTVAANDADPQKQAELDAKLKEIRDAAAAERTLREPGVVRRIYGQVAARPGLIALLLQIPNSNRIGQSIVIAVVAFAIWFLLLEGPAPSLAPR